MELFMCLGFMWILPIILSAVVGSAKGRTAMGAVLGLLLGWIGFIITLIVVAVKD